MRFINRMAAGRKLAVALQEFRQEDVIVLALPRGGVVTGWEVAKKLHVPLGLVMVRKIGHPAYAEYAIGAVAENGKPVYNETETAALDAEWLREAEMGARRLMAYRRGLYFEKSYIPPTLRDKTIIIVDDGIATGLTMEAAVLAVRNGRPKKIIVATPVSSREAAAKLRTMVDKVVVLDDNLMQAVGAHYANFPEVDDDTVRQLLIRRLGNDIRQTATNSTKP